MTLIRKIKSATSGSTLLSMMCFLFIAMGLVATILDLSRNHREIAAQQARVEQAMYVAEGGCERASRFVESNIAILAGASYTTTNGSGTIGNGTYYYTITKINTSTYSVVSSGSVSATSVVLSGSNGTVVATNMVSRVVQIKWLYQPTYASFAFWAATNGAINFVAGNVFNGSVHTDDPPQFQSSGSGSSASGAVFNSYMDTLANSYNGSTNGAYFAKGFKLNTYQGRMADVDFRSSAASSMKQIASNMANSLVLEGVTRILFTTNTIKITNGRRNWTNHVYSITNDVLLYVSTISNGPANTATGIVYMTGGVVSGRVTVVSENDIYLQSNVTYLRDPVSVTNSIDALGLVAGGDIWVDTNAPNNLVIYAAMMATGADPGLPATPTNFLSSGSFGVVNYNDTVRGSRGNLTLYGGIVQQVRGAVGTVSGSTVQSGYNKLYSYDPRFVANPPPYYPAVAGKFQYSGWAEGH